MLFRLLLGNHSLTGTSGRDNNIYFKGRDAAGLLGYRSPEYFVKNHCHSEKSLRDVIRDAGGLNNQQLDQKYMEFESMLNRKRGSAITRDWLTFRNLLSARVSMYLVQRDVVIKVEDEGQTSFSAWITWYYSTPVASATPQQQRHQQLPQYHFSQAAPLPQYHFSPATLQIPQPQYYPPAPPAHQSQQYTQHPQYYFQAPRAHYYSPVSPAYSPPSPQPTHYSPATPSPPAPQQQQQSYHYTPSTPSPPSPPAPQQQQQQSYHYTPASPSPPIQPKAPPPSPAATTAQFKGPSQAAAYTTKGSPPSLPSLSPVIFREFAAQQHQSTSYMIFIDNFPPATITFYHNGKMHKYVKQ